jgi:hypothetical protein
LGCQYSTKKKENIIVFPLAIAVFWALVASILLYLSQRNTMGRYEMVMG